VRKGKNFPKDVIEHWPEVFGEISLNVIPLHYLDSVIVTFKNGKNWEINFTNHSQEKFEIELKEWLSEYENEIDNIDFRLDTERIKKDIQKNTNKFLKNKKLK
jgi:predicted dithiol-disulfide oxidoreductase (DUF899 family)